MTNTCNLNEKIQTIVPLYGLMYGLAFEFCSTLAITSEVLETCAEKIKARVNSPRTFQ